MLLLDYNPVVRMYQISGGWGLGFDANCLQRRTSLVVSFSTSQLMRTSGSPKTDTAHVVVVNLDTQWVSETSGTFRLNINGA